MVRKVKMTHAEHVELAKKLCAAFVIVREARAQVSKTNGVSSHEAKQLARLFARFESARSALDEAYHHATNNEEFAQAGHVYYKTDTAQ